MNAPTILCYCGTDPVAGGDNSYWIVSPRTGVKAVIRSVWSFRLSKSFRERLAAAQLKDNLAYLTITDLREFADSLAWQTGWPKPRPEYPDGGMGSPNREEIERISKLAARKI